MTLDEAIKTLKGEAWLCCAEKWNEALNMAIKALEQEEQEPCDVPDINVGDMISRQKAIDAIDALYLDGDSPASHLANAEGDTLIGKYQAITALDDLPSVNPQSCEDAISRQDAIKKVSKILKGVFVEYEDIAQKAIGSLPSVTSQQKTGQWQQDLDGTYLCSECGSGFKEQPTLMGEPMFAWCPLCGAKMVESQESER